MLSIHLPRFAMRLGGRRRLRTSAPGETVPATTAPSAHMSGAMAAAIAAASIACLVIGALSLAIVGIESAGWRPANQDGPLHGSGILAVSIWACAWVILAGFWEGRTFPRRSLFAAAALSLVVALICLAVSFFLTIPQD